MAFLKSFSPRIFVEVHGILSKSTDFSLVSLPLPIFNLFFLKFFNILAGKSEKCEQRKCKK